MTEPKRSETAQDRLTRICDGMLATFNQHTEKLGSDRAIVFLNDETKGGIGIAGYADDTDAIMDLVVHLRALFRTRGLDLHFIPIGDTPQKDRA